MSFQTNPDVIKWQIHLLSPPQVVHQALATSNGRAKFWAESAPEINGRIHFTFPNGLAWQGKIIENHPPHRFAVEYFGGSIATFELYENGKGGTDLILTDLGVPPEDRCEVIAGWVSVLLALKAAIDFDVDLRNHDPERTWNQGYADN
ncbi:MAG: SRPBCC domain-containing protein [Candidatus Hodarchaeota archaeon]